MPPTLAATHLDLGANLLADGQCAFRVWAPNAQKVELRLVGHNDDREMRREQGDIFSIQLPARAGEKYFYIVNGGQPVPDPVSRSLPEGVHGPTEIVDPEDFSWSDAAWHGLELRDAIIYELHVGTFTREGTFDAIIERLDYLKKLGITMLELMPVAAFPGESGPPARPDIGRDGVARNWGYD